MPKHSRNIRFPPAAVLAAVLVLVLVGPRGTAWARSDPPPQPKNVILLIGDGMGPQQVRLAALYAYGEDGKLEFEKMPHRGEVTTDPVGETRVLLGRTIKPVTDSAAAATAMATGRKVRDGVLSAAIPGDGAPLRTVLEIFRERGARTGLVTSDDITGATPAAFGCHTKGRGDVDDIVRDYLEDSRPNVLFGGASSRGRGMTPKAARAAGYTVVTNRAEMLALKPGGERTLVLGQFGDGSMPYEYEHAEGLIKEANVQEQSDAEEYARDGLKPRAPPARRPDYDTLPHLSEMSAAALALLDNPQGVFLMIESGNIDHACHRHLLSHHVHETLEFEKTFRVVWEWARGRTDTLVIVTADHETGGLTLIRGWGKSNLTVIDWKNGGHTGVPVPVYAWGVGADRIRATIDNTELFEIMTGMPRPAPPADDVMPAPAARPAPAAQPAPLALPVPEFIPME